MNTIFYVIICIWLTYIAFILSENSDLLRKKNKEEKPETITYFTIDLDFTGKLLDQIDSMINDAIKFKILTYKELNKPYNLGKLDDDIRDISTNIHNGINGEIFLNEQVLSVTHNYIMNYIVDRTRTSLIETAIKYNNIIKKEE